MEKISYGELFSWVLASGFALAAGVFEVLDRFQNNDSRNKTALKLKKYIDQIKSSRFRNLPEIQIANLLNVKNQVTKGMIKYVFIGLNKSFYIYILGFCSLTIMIISIMQHFSLLWSFVISIIILTIWITGRTLVSKIPEYTRQKDGKVKKNPFYLIRLVPIFLLFLACGAFIIIVLFYVQGLLNLPLDRAFIYLLLSLPFMSVSVGHALFLLGNTIKYSKAKRKGLHNYYVTLNNTGHLIGISISLSFFISLLALLVGKLQCPTCDIYVSLPVLISNTVFDSLTVLVTFTLLGRCIPFVTGMYTWGYTFTKPLWIPSVIILDIVIALIFACLSLYLGLVFTNERVSIWESITILLNFKEGYTPFFWLMHTSFIPTLFYLAFIFFAWFTKAGIYFLEFLFRKATLVEKPHHLLAGICVLFSIIFTILSTAFDKFGC